MFVPHVCLFYIHLFDLLKFLCFGRVFWGGGALRVTERKTKLEKEEGGKKREKGRDEKDPNQGSPGKNF